MLGILVLIRLAAVWSGPVFYSLDRTVLWSGLFFKDQTVYKRTRPLMV